MKIICCDAVDFLDVCGRVRTVWMDPPDNLGLAYADDATGDKLQDYYGWVDRLLHRALLVGQVVWLSYHHSHDLEIKYLIRQLLRHRHPSWTLRQFLWTFTFSQYLDSDCSVAHRPIVRLSAPGTEWDFSSIRVASERMAQGDPRAAGPRVPPTTWDFPRVVGNAGERRPWHPTQHPVALVERAMRMCGDGTWVDLFAGSGTSLRAAVRAGKDDVVCVDKSITYCQKMGEEHALPVDRL